MATDYTLLGLTLAPQSIPHNTSTAVAWDTSHNDTNSLWSSGSPTRLTIPTGNFLVRITCGIVFAANSTGMRQVYLEKNGGTYPPGYISHTKEAHLAAWTGSMSWTDMSAPLVCTTGDYFELFVYQTSGAALDLRDVNSTWIAAEFLDN